MTGSRRGGFAVAALALAVVLGGCGSGDRPGAEVDPTSSATPTRTGGSAMLQHLDAVEEAFLDTESLTVLVASGATRDEVVAALDVDVSDEVADGSTGDVDRTAWSVVDIDGGVLAIERSGYGDPSLAALETLSTGGRSVAVVRSNIDGDVRFGSARDGAVLFDDDAYAFMEDPSTVPDEIRSLFDLAWDDLDGPVDADLAAPFTVGLAMVEVVTGVRLDAAQATAVSEQPFYGAPSLVYVPADDSGE